MLRRCDWCGLVLGQSKPLDEAGVTHGICLPCADRMLEEFRQRQAAAEKRYLAAGGTVLQAAPPWLPASLPSAFPS
jgi:hypothetical protein